MSPEEIQAKITELSGDLSKMKSQIRSGGAPENSGKIREIRRTIARLKTAAKLKGGLPAPSEAGPVAEKKKIGAEKKEKVKEKPAKKAPKKPAKPAKKAKKAPKSKK